jgi:integrase/recombinase XerD
MRSKNLSSSTIGIYTRNIRTLFNKAIGEKLISKEVYPFGNNMFTPPASKKAKKALAVEDIGKIYSYTPESKTEEWAKDMWLFAYFGNGINVKDIGLLKYRDIKDGEIHFIRAKTKNHNQEDKVIRIVLIEELQSIIKKWGKKSSKPSMYIFDIIKDENADARQVFRNINQAIKTINKYMARIAENLKLERKPTTNFPRHSYATVLKRAGIPIEMISEQLGHTSVKTTEIYLGSFEKEQRMELSKHLTAFIK